jgi:hypothetical protein
VSRQVRQLSDNRCTHGGAHSGSYSGPHAHPDCNAYIRSNRNTDCLTDRHTHCHTHGTHGFTDEVSYRGAHIYTHGSHHSDPVGLTYRGSIRHRNRRRVVLLLRLSTRRVQSAVTAHHVRRDAQRVSWKQPHDDQRSSRSVHRRPCFEPKPHFNRWCVD